MKIIYIVLALLFSFRAYANQPVSLEIKEVIAVTTKDEPLFLRYSLQVVEHHGFFYLLAIENFGGTVYKIDTTGAVIETLGSRDFNKEPKMVGEILTRGDQVVLNTRRELIFYATQGQRVETLSLGSKLASAVAIADPDALYVTDYETYDVPETWHYKRSLKSKKKSYFGERPEAVYKALRNPKASIPSWSRNRAYIIQNRLWFAQGYGSSIFIYNLDGSLHKRVHAPIFDAIMIEDIEYDEMLKDHRQYMLGAARTVNTQFDGAFFYQYLQRPATGTSSHSLILNIYDPDGNLLAHNLETGDPHISELIYAKGASEGHLFSIVQSEEIEADEALSPALQLLEPHLNNAALLRQDGTFIVKFKLHFQPKAG